MTHPITSKAFRLLNEENLAGAILELLSMKGVGISIASKIIGLLDQNRLAIYASPVGIALRTLKHECIRIIRCPPGRTARGFLHIQAMGRKLPETHVGIRIC
jgi:hypothetical protein